MKRLLTLPIVAPLTFVVAACVPASPPPPPVSPPAPVATAPAPPPVPTLGPDWRDWPLTPGTWSYRREAQGSVAAFGVTGAAPLLLLRCDTGARRMLLSLAGSDASSATLRTTSTTRALPLQPAGGAPARAATALAPGDPLLDAMAFSRGRFTVERSGRAPLVVPAHAEVGRVAEDCRD